MSSDLPPCGAPGKPIDLSALLRASMPQIEAEIKRIQAPKRATVRPLEVPLPEHTLEAGEVRYVNYAVEYDPTSPLIPLTREDGLPRLGDEYTGKYAPREGKRLRAVQIEALDADRNPGRVTFEVTYAYTGDKVL